MSYFNHESRFEDRSCQAATPDAQGAVFTLYASEILMNSPTTELLEHFCWIPRLDSNQSPLIQSQVSYH